MLMLTRRVGQTIRIGPSIVIVVQHASGGRARIGIEAPDDVKIIRGELEMDEEEPQNG